MLFSSLVFIFVFLPIVLLIYYSVKNRNVRNIVLLLASLFFYAWGEYIYVFLMILSIVINYFLALLIDKNKSRKYLIIAIFVNVLLLGVFKYTDFIITIINVLFNLNISQLNIPLPIGISFYTFQILSYVIDVYLKKVKVQKNILNLGCYISFFPQLIAGPIVRYETIEEQLTNRTETISGFAYGIRRFIRGLGKKILIADNVAFIANSIFALSPTTYGFVGAWVGMIAYSLQIYFDFSGYSDMAIGLGEMFGFKFLENFNFPYIASSVTDFWRRWHISLSSWFREYVYIPLGGNRVKKSRFILNILIVWALTGLWHGASINFIIWGLYYGILLLLEKLVFNKILEKSPKIMQHIYTLLIVIIGWTIFRVTSLTELKDIIGSMIGLNGIGTMKLFISTGIINFSYLIAFILGIILSTPILNKIKIKNSYIKDIVLILLLIVSILYIVVGSYSPFIYFRF